MRICSPHCGLAENSGSGGEVFERDLLRGLADAGDTPHILLAQGKSYPREMARYIEPIWPLRRGLRWPVAAGAFAYYILRCWRQHRFDLLRAHSLRFTGPACLLAKRLGVTAPLVVHLHHLDPDPLNRLIERPVMEAADLVIADSHFAAGQAKALGVRHDRIRVAHCGAPEQYRPAERLSPGDGAVAEKYGLWGHDVVLAVGPLIERKDPHLVVRAFAAAHRPGVDDAVLLWMGAGPLKASVAALADGLGVGDRVRFPGHVPESDKMSLYRLADLFVHGSRLEGFPLAVLEAMACGKPVVGFRAASMEELVVPGGTGLLADTPAEFARHLGTLLASPGLRKAMGATGARRIDQRFRWSRTVAEVRRAYYETVGNAAPRG